MKMMWFAAAAWLAGCGGSTESIPELDELRDASERMRSFGISRQRIRSYESRVEVDLLDAASVVIGKVRIEEVDGVRTELELGGRTVSLTGRGEEQRLEVDGAPAEVNEDDRPLIDLLLEISVGALTRLGSDEEAPFGWCSGISTQQDYWSAWWAAYWQAITSCGAHFYSNYIRVSDAQNPQTLAWTVAISAHYFY